MCICIIQIKFKKCMLFIYQIMRQVNLPPMQVRSMENPREVVGEAKEVPNYYCCYCYVEA